MQSFLERIAPLWQPHPGQREFLLNHAKIKVLACGRRWGKTDACAVQILASLFQPSPRRHVIIAPTQDQAGLLFERTLQLVDAVLGEGEGIERPKVRRTPYPRFDWKGHRVAARSGHLGRSLRGNEATDIVIDEAAFVPEELIAEVAMPMLATTNGSLTLISTPRGMNHFWRFYMRGQEDHPSSFQGGGAGGGISSDKVLKEALPDTLSPCPLSLKGEGAALHPSSFQGGGAGGGGDCGEAPLEGISDTLSPCPLSLKGEGVLTRPTASSFWSRRAPTSENPMVSPQFLDLQRTLVSDRAFRVEYEAEFLDSAGRVFRTEAIDACLVPYFEEDPREPYAIGVDWARYGDFTAVAVLSGYRQRAMLVEAERFHGLPWAEQVEKVTSIIRRYPRAVVRTDATGAGDVLEGLLKAKAGANVEGVVFTSASKAQLIENLTWMLENEALRMTPQPELIRELQHFESKELPSGRRRLGAMSGFHDDLVVALALGCSALAPEQSGRFWVGAKREFSKMKRRIGRLLEI